MSRRRPSGLHHTSLLPPSGKETELHGHSIINSAARGELIQKTRNGFTAQLLSSSSPGGHCFLPHQATSVSTDRQSLTPKEDLLLPPSDVSLLQRDTLHGHCSEAPPHPRGHSLFYPKAQPSRCASPGPPASSAQLAGHLSAEHCRISPQSLRSGRLFFFFKGNNSLIKVSLQTKNRIVQLELEVTLEIP